MAIVKRGTITIMVAIFSLISFIIFQLTLSPTNIRVMVRADRTTGEIIRPVWTRLNVWDITMAPSEPPAPFIREVILMTATGGRDTSEIFSLDPERGPIHDFSKIDLALDKVLQAGLEPTIVIGNTPEDLSDSPGERGAFNANIGAPKDYDLYYDYVQAFFAHLVERYGLQRVDSLNFRLMTEPDNIDWWKHGLLEYQKLYDYTVAAARSSVPNIVIDVGNLMNPIGDGAWTPQLLKWLSSDLNSSHPDSVPREIGRLSFSCYARGQMGMDPRELGEIAQEIRDISPDLAGVPLSVDEGMILFDKDGTRLWLGDGTELGAAWNAAIMKVCLDHDIERYVQWGFQTDGVKSPAYNVISMYELMLGDKRLETSVKGEMPSRSYLDAISSVSDDGNVRILAFHYRPDRSSFGAKEVKILVDGLSSGSYRIDHWRVDKNHSNFFTKWLEDSRDISRVDTGSGSGSTWDLGATGVLGRRGWELWNSMKNQYLDIDDLERMEPQEIVQIDRRFSKEILLPVNGVSLIELKKT